MRARNVNLIITHDVQLTTTIMSGFRRMADIGDRDGYATRTHTRVQKAREELICPICIETFKEPRTLACQHTFCTACLEQLASSHKRSPLVRRIPEKCGPEASCDIRTATTEVTVSCPECRTNITLPENGINGECVHSSCYGACAFLSDCVNMCVYIWCQKSLKIGTHKHIVGKFTNSPPTAL